MEQTLVFALLFGSFISLVCAIIVALRQNMKNRHAIAQLYGEIQKLK